MVDMGRPSRQPQRMADRRMEKVDGQRPRPVVLWIEDDDGDVELFRQGMAEAGAAFHLVVVPNAVQGLAFLARLAPFQDVPVPDLIVVDLNLPMISGHEFIREVRLRQPRLEIPMMLLTSSLKPEDRERARRAGVGFYTKPVTWDAILELCREFARALDSGRPCGCRP